MTTRDFGSLFVIIVATQVEKIKREFFLLRNNVISISLIRNQCEKLNRMVEFCTSVRAFYLFIDIINTGAKLLESFFLYHFPR